MPALPLPDSLRVIVPHEPGGPAWLEALPGLVAGAVERLGLPWPGAPFEGGFASWTAPVDDARVLKLRFPDVEARAEPDALRLLGGDGAVRLLALDDATGAMVLERARPGTPLLDHPDADEALAIACALLRRVARPLPPAHPFDGQAEVVGRWVADARAARHLPAARRRQAAERIAALARPASPPVLGNQDAHLGNVVRAAREPWLLIDPKPVAGERALDTGHLVRDVVGRLPDPPAAVAATVARVADLLDLPPRRVAAWVEVRSLVDLAWSGPDDDLATDLAIAEAARALV